MTDPGYPCNEVFVRAVGAVPTPLIVTAAQRFQPTAAQLRRAWGPATRGVLLAAPANPTGTMLARQELAASCEVARERDGFLILDEIYQGLVPAPAYASGLAVDQDLIVLNSFSKFFGMTGWRLGWIVLPDALCDAATSWPRICSSVPVRSPVCGAGRL